MKARKRLMSLSLIALAVFSACTDEVGNGGQLPVKGDHSLSFAVSTPGSQTWTKADGTRAASAPATQELEPVEMEGKVNGQTVYLSAEVTDGFPSDNRMMTRGTQVTEDNKTKDGIMETFAVSAYTDIKGTPDFMYSVPTTKGSPENGTTYWYPEEKFYWPGVKPLNFYAWYPYTANAEGLTVSGADEKGIPTLHYIAPDDVKKQMDVMTAVATNQAEQEAIPLTFDHALSAVKFVAGSDLPNCVVKSVKLYNLQYEGTYDIASSTWTEVKSDKKDFTLNLSKTITGTAGTPITDDDQTLFMMPQDLPTDAKIEVVLNDGTSDLTVGASIGGTEWEMGKTYTYRISHRVVSLITSNDTFTAYHTQTIANEVAFYLTATPPTEGDTIKLEANGGITVSPTFFKGSVKNQPVRITHAYNGSTKSARWTEIRAVTITMGNLKKTVVINRTTIADGDSHWLYTVPETTSASLGKDVLSVKNVSGADWLGITSSSTYTKDNYQTDTFENTAKGDIYLQTLSIPTTSRYATLLVTKDDGDASKNEMISVEQKAITADFGFKDCERNISRESEQWKIKVSGGRFKENSTVVKARVVISSSVPDAQIIPSLGRDLTVDGKVVDISIDKASGTGISGLYKKKRWDNQTETDANHGTRAVNVQLYSKNSKTWYDIAGTGTMADWMPWGGVANVYQGPFVISNKSSAVNTNIYWGLVYPTYTQTYMVHENHPFFGKTKWQVPVNADMSNLNAAYEDKNTATGYIWANRKALHGFGTGGVASDITGISYIILLNTSTVQTYANYQANQIEPMSKCRVFGIGAQSTNPNTKTVDWNQPQTPKLLIANIPVIYTVRPTNDNPITGTSVNE